MMQNLERSTPFIKIKQNIERSRNLLQLTTCIRMIENATPDNKPSDALFKGLLCTNNEIIILNEYLQTAATKYQPIN